MQADHQPRRKFPLLGVLFGIAILLSVSIATYHPDRPVRTLVPGASAEPAFVVQIIRPRASLPLGGLIPPKVFGVDAKLGFDSKTEGARWATITPQRIEWFAPDWELVIATDEAGRPTKDTFAKFELLFEDQPRTVVCRPAEPPIGAWQTTPLAGGAELAGHFSIELAHCEDASTGQPLGWPPQPLLLRGSFDRLPQSSKAVREE